MKNRKKIIICVSAGIAVILIVIFYSALSNMAGLLLLEQSGDVRNTYRETKDSYHVYTYDDSETGLSVEYDLYIPDDYDENTQYPLITFIGDMSAVGTDPGKSLKVGLGATIWASAAEQEKHPSFVLIPQFPEVILDDRDGFTMTPYVELVPRLIRAVCEQYSVDADRIYGTGQSMGCMTTMYLAANDSGLYTAVLLIDGQWNIDELNGLSEQKFIYIAAGGDDRAVAGQAEVKKMLEKSGVSFNEIVNVDATEYASGLTESIGDFLSRGYDRNFISFARGTVLPWYVPDSVSEHMYSFNYGYRLEAARDWLLRRADDRRTV